MTSSVLEQGLHVLYPLRDSSVLCIWIKGFFLLVDPFVKAAMESVQMLNWSNLGL